MSVLPRWYDDFSTDPTSDPAYLIGPSITYNGTLDQLEMSSTSVVNTDITLLNSKNSYGIAEFDLYWTNDSNGQTFAVSCKAFGYWFVNGKVVTTSVTHQSVLLEDDSPASLTGTNLSSTSIISKTNQANEGFFRVKFIATPNSTDIYVDDILFASLPPRAVNSDVAVKFNKNFGGISGTYACSKISVKSDASLPKLTNILQPSLAGPLPASDGPIIVDVPEVRLYLDLGAYAPGITGVDNVVYDPGGAAVSMSEDVGIPDRAGNTNGDFYLEIPINEVSSDYRLVFKDEFVLANSVVVSDDVDLDILPSPATQNLLVVEEDDLQLRLEKSSYENFTEPYSLTGVTEISDFTTVGLDIRPANNLILQNAANFEVHNSNADGNASFYNTRVPAGLFNDNFVGIGDFVYNSGFSYPILIDIDMQRVRNITNLYLITTSLSSHAVISCDIYSKDTPFSGAGVQGTLEYDDFPIINTFGNSISLGLFLKGVGTRLNIKSRYLRLQINADNVIGSSGNLVVGRQIYLFGKSETSIDSENDNGQFQHQPESGGGFVAFPAGGVTQADGQVAITLPAEMEVLSGAPNDYFRLSFKPDLTD